VSINVSFALITIERIQMSIGFGASELIIICVDVFVVVSE
jgi:hypothetical protein